MQQFDDNPQFSTLRAAHRVQFGLSIAYVKRKVGTGTEYINEVARAVLSPTGGYYELAEMPEEFAGALGENVSHRLIGPDEARETLQSLQTLTAEVAAGTLRVRALSLYVLYAGGSLKARRGMFVCDWGADTLFQHGAWQPDVLPRFFKLRFEADGDAPPGLPQSGVVFFLAPRHAADGQALLATFARHPGAVDLGARPMPTTMH